MAKAIGILLAVILILSLRPQAVFGIPPQPDGWVAGETSVSGLSPEEQALLCMAQEDRELMLAQTMRLYREYTYAPMLDWRDRNGLDFTTPIRNQRRCGSCVAFAVVASIESRLEIALGTSYLDPDLSEAHTFFCGCGECCMRGWWPHEALGYIAEHGISDEECFPYSGRDVPCNPCPDCRERAVDLTGWVRVEGEDEMKQAIMAGGPVIAIMDVMQDFFWYKGGIYCPTVPWLVGLHAVTLVGYNDDEEYWIAKNSWGQDWGEDGWFRIGYRLHDVQSCGLRAYAYIPFVDAEAPYKIYFPMVVKGASDD